VAQLDYSIAAIEGTLPGVRDLAIGGTAVGTGLNAPKGFGEAVAKLCLEKNITKVVFDRNGYVYQENNRVGALADGARKAGLSF
jgi:fumarate hydratase class II